MPEGILIAIIGALGVIIAAGVTAYFKARTNYANSSGKNKSIAILAPRNGEEIVFYSKSETKPIKRTVSGKIAGFNAKEVLEEGLQVEIAIHTDIWYKQGVTPAQPNGDWKLEGVRFGGRDHRIRATLKDKMDRTLCTTDIKVTVADR